ncbi:MAG: hypothetical protein KDK59_08935 [Simkania sp.]|nr:hypothetical protein [Simkania sp.]
METLEPSIPLRMRIAPYKNSIFVGVLALLLVMVFVIKLGNKTHKNEADFVSATNAFVKWEQVLDTNNDELRNLATIMKKHPELKAEYEAKLAQDFIAMQESNKAREFGSSVIQRTNQPYYSDYAKASLLVSEGKFLEALEQALYLKKQMLEDEAFWTKSQGVKNYGSGLFAFNLMRIATLYQELGMKDRELEAWSELKAFAGWNGAQKDVRIKQEGFQSLLNHFTVQDMTLLDYISAREAELTR